MTTACDRFLRPFRETLKATKSNELIHFDYLTGIEGTGGTKDIIV